MGTRRARALAAAYAEYASDPPSVGARTSRAALHLDLFERPVGSERFSGLFEGPITGRAALMLLVLAGIRTPAPPALSTDSFLL